MNHHKFPTYRIRSLLLSLALLVCFSPAGAQSAEQGEFDLKQELEIQIKKAQEAEYRGYRELSRGSNSATDGVDNDLVTVEAGQANGKGTITWKPKEDCSVDRPCWSLKFSAPTDKDSQVTDFTDLDSLAKDTSFGFSWRKTMIKGSELDEFFEELDLLCADLSLAECDDATIATALETATDPTILERGQFIQSTARGASSVWFIDGTLSVNDYDFFGADEVKADTRKYGARIKLGYARVVGPARLSVAASLERSYEASKTMAQRCEPVGTTGALESCTTLPLGQPTRQDSPKLQVEYRRQTGSLVFSPLASYDFDQDISALELPFYFLRDSKGTFTGGFKVGWRSDKDEVAGSVFISKPLPFL